MATLMATTQKIGGWLRNVLQQQNLPTHTQILGVSIIGGIGLSTLLIHLFHLFIRTESLYTTLIGTVLPILLSTILLGMGVWMYGQEFDNVIIWAGMWCLVGTVVLIGMSVVSITYQLAKGVIMTELFFVVANHATVGALLGTLLGLYDGQRHKRKQKLQAEQKRARQLSSQLTILNRVLRHDIRTTVNIIQGNVALLRNGTAEIEQVTDTINTKTQELLEASSRTRQLQQLLEQDTVQTSQVDLAPTLHTKTLALKNEYSGVEIKRDIPESVEVRANSLIEAAIDELLENAIEHNDADTPCVEVTVTVSFSQLQADGGAPETATICISDNGPGIPDDEINVLERGHETDLDHLSGLGLWLVYWVVDASGGDLAFEANEPRGSVVKIDLPTATTVTE
jgi:signal transduction histidine kinase